MEAPPPAPHGRGGSNRRVPRETPVLPGTLVPVDIHLVDDGVTPITAYGGGTSFNDTPGVLGLMPPTVSGPVVGGILVPADLATAFPAAPVGTPLGPLGIPPFGAGPGGPSTGTDGGAGIYDLAGAAWIGMPGLGGTVVCETVTFTAMGPIGSVSDVAPLGILGPPGPPVGAVPPVFGPGGLEFYDATGLGAYGAVGFAPGANPAFPAGLPAVRPGTIGIIPEPGGALPDTCGFAFLLLRRWR